MSTNIIKQVLMLIRNNPEQRKLNNIRYYGSYSAAVLKKLDRPLEIEEVKPAKIPKNKVRLQVHYCSVNIIDINKFNGKQNELPFIPGYEFSGEVLEIGKNVDPAKICVGEKVAVLNFDHFGGLSEECVVDINNIWRIPSNVGLKDAAVLLCGHATALYVFGKLIDTKEEHSVLVSTAVGGLGLAAVDVAANVYKAKVCALTDTEINSELTRDAGATKTYHFKSGVHKSILKDFSNEGVDIIFDSVGGDMLEEVNKCVKPGGHVFASAPFQNDLIPKPQENTSLTMVSLQTLCARNLELYRSLVSDTLELANDGVISAFITKEFSLEDINKAIEFINSKRCTGKVVINLNVD